MKKYYYIPELQQAYMLHEHGQGGVTFRIQGTAATDFRVEFASFGQRTADFLSDPANTRLQPISQAEYQAYEAKFWAYVAKKVEIIKNTN